MGGHELLDTMRSKPVWERTKKVAAEKGIELSFEAVRLLAVRALAARKVKKTKIG